MIVILRRQRYKISLKPQKQTHYFAFFANCLYLCKRINAPKPNLIRQSHFKRNSLMKAKQTITLITLIMTVTSGFAQEKLSSSELKAVANSIETDWRFGSSGIIWFEDQGRLNYYLETAPMRCLDDLTEVVNLAETWHADNQRILQFKQQVYPKPGTKKSEQSLAQYIKDTSNAIKKFQQAQENEAMYQRLIREVQPLINAKKQQTFTPPTGALTHFHFRQGGGMVYRPPLESTLDRMKDGTYRVTLDTEEFDILDTIPLTQAQVDTVRQMLIEGEVYKMPAYYDEPYLLLDAPSSSVSVHFTDATYRCTSFPPRDWGGKNIWAVYRYLKGLQPKRHE